MPTAQREDRRIRIARVSNGRLPSCVQHLNATQVMLRIEHADIRIDNYFLTNHGSVIGAANG
jgi:hypothetical protein